MEVAMGVKDWVKMKGKNEWYGGLGRKEWLLQHERSSK